MPTRECPYAKSDMTPCVLKDGAICWAVGNGDQPICVGCEHSPRFLKVPFPADWEATMEEVRRDRADMKRRGGGR